MVLCILDIEEARRSRGWSGSPIWYGGEGYWSSYSFCSWREGSFLSSCTKSLMLLGTLIFSGFADSEAISCFISNGPIVSYCQSYHENCSKGDFCSSQGHLLMADCFWIKPSNGSSEPVVVSIARLICLYPLISYGRIASTVLLRGGGYLLRCHACFKFLICSII